LHWWHPLAESGLRSGYSDDLLWLPFVTLYYIHETGDSACLNACATSVGAVATSGGRVSSGSNDGSTGKVMAAAPAARHAMTRG